MTFRLRVAFLRKNGVNPLEHKSLAPVNLKDDESYSSKLGLIKNYLTTKKKYYKEIFENCKSNKTEYSGKYKLLKLDDDKKDIYDKITLDFFDFLKHIEALTPGTDDDLPPWIILLPDGDVKTARKYLHYKYGTGNAPPLQSHHVTLDYNNSIPNKIVNHSDINIIFESIVIYTTNLAGELIDEVWTSPF
tara:strand:+ start:2115 stop:2684 length:570 start_codon:yes stop_codon:yes gene_type:complete